MSLPTNSTLDSTLLVFISLCGGMISRAHAPGPLANHFRLTEADLQEKRKDDRPSWPNSCDFSRNRLADDGYLYRPNAVVGAERIVVTGLWMLTPEGGKKAEQTKRLLGEAALSRLEGLAAPIKKENDDPLRDLF